MAKPRLFATATQDAKGFWWAEDSDGNRYAVDPYSDDEGFNGFRQVDRRFEETSTPQGAGLPMESWRWKSGQVLTPQDMAEVSRVMSTPGAYVGVNGPMSVEQYLADPRSAIKVENGQYVYRPEQAQGDWESIDRESFMQSLGAIPFVLGSFAAPFLSSLGVIGPGANVMGSTGNMQFLGDVGTGAGAAEGAAGAAGSSAINEVGSFTGDATQGWNVYDTLANPSGIETGTFTTAVDGGTLSNAMEIGADAGSNAINEVGSFTGDSSAGWNVADTVGGTGGGTIADGINWDLINETGSFTGDPTQGWNVSNLSNVPGGIERASALSRLLSGNGTLEDYLRVGGTVASGILGATSANNTADALREESARLDAMQAPWRARLSDLYANPSGFLTSAPVASSIDQGAKAVGRVLSTQYGNPALAPNAMAEINKYAANSLYDKFGAEANRLAAFGGLNFPATASSGMNTQAAQADSGVADAAGYMIGQLTAPKNTMSVADWIKAMQSGNIFGTSSVGV